MLLAIPAVAIAVSLAVRSQTSPPSIPPVALSSDPLYATTSGDKPTMALALSVEWPTAGAQYYNKDTPFATTDDSYKTDGDAYIGYYDSESCYTYNDSPTETPLPGQTAADYKRFDRTGPATSRMCADGFSGNFLNWASSSAIDMLRLALSGGDRYIDREDMSILQRAIVPNGDPHCLWNHVSFPGKKLQRNGGSAGAYWGAVPVAMRTAAGTNDIWVANTLNQIFFGTAKGGSCGAAGVYAGDGSYTLGSTIPVAVGPVTNGSQSLPSDASPACATEGGICKFTGTREVWYGAGTQWAVAPASAGALCSFRVFGDPAPGINKACYTRSYSGSWAPSSAVTLVAIGPISTRSQSLPTDAQPICATEGGTCTFTGIKEVWYGVGTSWAVAPAMDSTLCSYTQFGDPAVGRVKGCYTRPYSGSWLPTFAMAPGVGSITTRNQSLPSDASPACAGESGVCAFTGVKEVWYGADTRWFVTSASGSIPCNNGQFGGDPAPGAYKSCYTRRTNSALNSDGFFYARVKVCDQDGSTLLDDRAYGPGLSFCTKYPSGRYKPTGAIQKYSDSFRLAASGYALDNSGRYGGVLRAPMKYVGSKTFDVYGQENTPAGGNPAAEWDTRTGVFRTNPDGDTTQTPAISGVINYLNKFGRTGPTPGRYKDLDPVGELYYETLRYLQGLPPSPAAIGGLTPAMYDGFPILTDWSALDPFGNRSASSSYACLKNNIVVIGDIESHDSPGYARFPAVNVAANIPDFAGSLNTVAAFEQGNVADYWDGQGVKRQTGNPNPPNSYAFGPQFGIVGTAYWAHTHDIRGASWTNEPAKQRPGLRVKTFTFDVNAYGRQNVAETRRYRNQFFLASKYGGFESMLSKKSLTTPYNTWGNPFVDVNGTPNNDVWQDPAHPGEAGTYSLQSSGLSVLSAFDRIFAKAGEPVRSVAGAAARSSTLTAGTNNTIYQAEFDTTDWSGDLLAFTVSVDSSNNVSLAEQPAWRAADRLSRLADPVNSRNIVVGNPGATASPIASPFTWTAISADLQAALNRPDASSAADDLGEHRLNFIRGDHSKEGSLFRNRVGKRLGDIVNSGVAYSGVPSNAINATTYPAFRQSNLDRTPALFVGANDGMLHAFNADTGDELFGYIPSWLGPKLSALTSTTYVNNHQSYVDASPVVAEAQVGSTDTSDNWKTVLVGGTGAGGRGVYALDVTNPAAFSASKVMWEFTPADDVDLGYVVGRPQILKFRTSASGTPTYKWFAVVASGVNNYVPDSAGLFSSTGKPALYLLDLAKQPGVAWSLGSNYYKISIPIDSTLSATHATGVVSFKAVLGAQQEVTKLFVGDLHGKLWKLDFQPHGSANWNMGTLSAFNAGSDTSPQPYPLYAAKDSTGKVQPISAAPMLVRGEGKESIYVAFGTGKYLEAPDRSATIGNSFYVVHDDGTKKADGGTSPVTSAITGRGRLKAGTFDSTTGSIDVAAFVWGRATSDTDTTQRSGWYFDYPGAGERQVSGISLIGDKLIFNSLIPDPSITTSICAAGGGTGRAYLINVDTGDGTSTASTVGLLGESIAMKIESATTWTKTDSTGRRHRFIKTQTFSQGSAGVAARDVVITEELAGRLSWRQVHNYQDLKAE